MTVLADALTSSNASDITSSDIFAKLKRDVEFITYDIGTGDEYFINLQQKKLSTIQFTLTDSKNRQLGRHRTSDDTTNPGFNNGSGTAAGYDTGTAISNFILCFSLCHTSTQSRALRWGDVIPWKTVNMYLVDTRIVTSFSKAVLFPGNTLGSQKVVPTLFSKISRVATAALSTGG